MQFFFHDFLCTIGKMAAEVHSKKQIFGHLHIHPFKAPTLEGKQWATKPVPGGPVGHCPADFSFNPDKHT